MYGTITIYRKVDENDTTTEPGRRRTTKPQESDSLSNTTANNKKTTSSWVLSSLSVIVLITVLFGVHLINRTGSINEGKEATATLLSSTPRLSTVLNQSTNNIMTTPTRKASLSQRGSSLGQVRDDLPMFGKGLMDPYHPTTNPDGYLVMLVAENKLMWKEMAKKIEDFQTKTDIPSWTFNYGGMGGEGSFKDSMAKMMKHWIHAPIDSNYLYFQDGAGPMLSQLSFVLTDADDGVLTAAPGYMAFVSDFGIYTGAKFHWISSDAENRYVPTIAQLEEGYFKSVKAGNPPKIFVICQPHNPTGVVFSKEEMTVMIDWALSKKDLHIISDEIYALSTFPDYPTTTSAADVMYEKFPNQTNYMGDYVHVVAGLSKDWGMSGFRIGSLFSHNIELLRAIDTVGYYGSPSRYTQFILQGVFNDDDFVTWYIEENRRRLYETYQALEEALSLIDVPLLPSQGAIFAWGDFSSLILDGQSERDLWMELFNKTKVALTTGQSCEANKPGMFRIVYGWPEGGVDAMKEFGRRLVTWKANRETSPKVFLAAEHPIDLTVMS